MREARVLITPAMAPLKAGGSVGGSSVAKESGSMAGEDRWRDPDGSSSVNAVSFGFVATAILVSMFLFMALFEHFLRPRGVGGDSTTVGDRSGRRRGLRFWGWRRRGDGADLEVNKLCFPSPEIADVSLCERCISSNAWARCTHIYCTPGPTSCCSMSMST